MGGQYRMNVSHFEAEVREIGGSWSEDSMNMGLLSGWENDHSTLPVHTSRDRIGSIKLQTSILGSLTTLGT